MGPISASSYTRVDSTRVYDDAEIGSIDRNHVQYFIAYHEKVLCHEFCQDPSLPVPAGLVSGEVVYRRT